MEEQLLELYRSENSAPISPDGSCKGAGDRSGPIVGSWDLWPGSTSPLSASLASSEGMMSSATTASGLAGRAEDIKNLQVYKFIYYKQTFSLHNLIFYR